MNIDAKALYSDLKPALDELSASAVDPQTDLSERLSLVEAARCVKPSFMGYADARGRDVAFEGIARILPSDLAHGFTDAEVHHRYRPFFVGDPELAVVLSERAKCVQSVFWAARDPDLVQTYRRGHPNVVPDDELLGYPRCCIEWHYDVFFARGIEAFCAVAAVERSNAMLDFVRQVWRPESGFYLPERMFLAAILRSNTRFPFIEHVACPYCLASDDSPTARIDGRRSALALELDPNRHAGLLAWARKQERVWKAAATGRTRLIAESAVNCAETTRGIDEYARHARYLARAMQL